MSQDGPITKWIGDVKQGEAADAEQGLWKAYFQRLMDLAGAKMRNAPTSCEDEEDVALSAMKSFFCRVRDGHFPELKDRTELWPLLVQTTIWKVQNHRRRHFAKRRDARKVMSLDWLAENGPTADLAKKVIEEGNSLLEALTDDRLRTVTALKLEGFSNAEIAKKINRTEKTVEWRLRQVRKQLRAVMAEDNSQ